MPLTAPSQSVASVVVGSPNEIVYRANYWTPVQPISDGTSVSLGVGSDSVFLAPYFPSKAFTSTAMRLFYTSTTGGGNVRGVLYDADEDGLPNSLLYATDPIAVAAIAEIVYGYTFTALKSYWIGIVADTGGNTASGMSLTKSVIHSGPVNGAATARGFYRYLAGAFNNPPNPYGAATPSTPPKMWLKMA